MSFEWFLQTKTNPFGVPVDFRLLNAEKYELSSPVITGANTYLAAKLKREKHFEIALGYSFENVCLYATSQGVSTVILAESLSRSAFEKAMDLQPGEVMPAASPVGYRAEKRTIRDNLIRKRLKADERLAFEALFFEGTFGSPLPKERAGDFAEALELARWAPSAMNKQPWRAIVCGDTVHFYEAQSMRESPLYDIQKVDVGIFLAHFDLTMQENDRDGRFFDADPGLAVPENVHYVISYEKSKETDTRFSSAIHMLILLAGSERLMDSWEIARSVGTKVSHIRKLAVQLKAQGIISGRVRADVFGLRVPPEELSLLRVYRAVAETERVRVFDLHQNPSDRCAVGRHIQPVLTDVFRDVEQQAERELQRLTLADCIQRMRMEMEASHEPSAD